MDYLTYKSSYLFTYSSNQITKEQFSQNSDKINKILKFINEHIESNLNHKNFELMLVYYRKLIEYVELRFEDDGKLSGEIIQMYLNYANALKKY